MTDFDGMEAGREMDALIAKRIMKLRVLSWTEYQNRRRDPDPCLISDGEGFTINRKGGPHGTGWSPSADIEDAWEVVEGLAGASFGLDRFINFDEDARFFAHFAGEGVDVGASAPTAPLAICRAALKFVSQAREAAA